MVSVIVRIPTYNQYNGLQLQVHLSSAYEGRTVSYLPIFWLIHSGQPLVVLGGGLSLVVYPIRLLIYILVYHIWLRDRQKHCGRHMQIVSLFTTQVFQMDIG